MQESREHLKSRVYYAVKDGMSLALYTLFVGANRQEVENILNEVYFAHGGVCV